jgi:hypothetical protein
MKQRLMKRAETFAEPGERVVAACVGQQTGVVAGQAVGGLAGAVIAGQVGKGERAEAAASGFPMARSMVVAATDRRIIVFFGKKLLGTVDRDQIAGAEVIKKRMLFPSTIGITMRNGHTAKMAVNRYTGPAELVAAVQALVSEAAA